VFLLFVSKGLMPSLEFDIAHLLAGGMLVLSFLLLYQDRIAAVINVFAMQAVTAPKPDRHQRLRQHGEGAGLAPIARIQENLGSARARGQFAPVDRRRPAGLAQLSRFACGFRILRFLSH
jgi:hypothetical protein